MYSLLAFIEARTSYLWLSTAGGLSIMDWLEGHSMYGMLVLALAYHYENMGNNESV